ncbi:phosphotransferase enzyme family protein [Gottfriedia luciferensis]|uniref:phosphotransferase enzyme family protein n=1 Tax=Gottfriedia luciferensis TaxID=178774 RepID=UPI000B454137|nr:phosphotransferase [Gottfriedia luciferensis]
MNKKLSGGFQNDVFYDQKSNRIIRKSNTEKTKRTVLQEIEWVNFLHKQGLDVAKADLNVEYENGRIITYFEYIDGVPMDVTNPKHWNKSRFEQWGKILGKMHSLSKEYKISEIYRPIWSYDNPDVFRIREQLQTNMKEIYNKYIEKLLEFRKSPSTFGLIHNDFHQGNLIVVEDKLFIIDFDNCAYNWFAQDIATAFYHAYWQQTSFNRENEHFIESFMKHFFKGYKQENVIHSDVIEQIPIFLKLRELFLYNLFTVKWDLNQLEDWQKYTLNDLQNKIMNEIPYADQNDFSIYV